MNYYLLRDAFTGEAESVYATWSIMLSDRCEEISQAEFETYKEFGIPASVSPFDPNFDLKMRKTR